MNNPKIGEFLASGEWRYPTETLAGAAYSRGDFDAPPAIVHHLDDVHFAIGDVWPPRGFDVQGALDRLMAELKPAAAPSGKKSTEASS